MIKFEYDSAITEANYNDKSKPWFGRYKSKAEVRFHAKYPFLLICSGDYKSTRTTYPIKFHNPLESDIDLYWHYFKAQPDFYDPVSNTWLELKAAPLNFRDRKSKCSDRKPWHLNQWNHSAYKQKIVCDTLESENGQRFLLVFEEVISKPIDNTTWFAALLDSTATRKAKAALKRLFGGVVPKDTKGTLTKRHCERLDELRLPWCYECDLVLYLGDRP